MNKRFFTIILIINISLLLASCTYDEFKKESKINIDSLGTKKNQENNSGYNFQLFIGDRTKVNTIAKDYGLDSALILLGYNAYGGNEIGVYDRMLMNDLFGYVESSPPAKSILFFLREYYEYPKINKEKYKRVFINYLSKWIENSSEAMDNYLFEELLSVMVDCGGEDMNQLINKYFYYWSNLANNLNPKIVKEQNDEDLLKNAFFAQYALKHLKSSLYNEKEFLLCKEKSMVKEQIPNFTIEQKFACYSNYKKIICNAENENILLSKPIKSLNDLMMLDEKDILSTFDLEKDDSSNMSIVIFLNGNIGYIFVYSLCNHQKDGLDCQSWGILKSIKKQNSQKIITNRIASWL